MHLFSKLISFCLELRLESILETSSEGCLCSRCNTENVQLVNGFEITAIGSQLTYCDAVAICPVPVTSIRQLRIVRNFSFGFGFVIGSITHGPSSTV